MKPPVPRAPERTVQPGPACAGCRDLRNDLDDINKIARAALSLHLMKTHPGCLCGALATRSIGTKHPVQGMLTHYVCDACGPNNAGDGAAVLGAIDVRHGDVARMINAAVRMCR